MSEMDLLSVTSGPADLRTASTLGASRTALRGAGKAAVRDDPQLVQAAKDFESVLLGKMMEEMHNTVEDSGLLEDSGTSQIQGMFWSFMAKDVADKGGVGLWKDLYDQWSRSPAAGSAAQGAKAAAAAGGGPAPASASEVLP